MFYAFYFLIISLYELAGIPLSSIFRKSLCGIGCISSFITGRIHQYNNLPTSFLLWKTLNYKFSIFHLVLSFGFTLHLSKNFSILPRWLNFLALNCLEYFFIILPISVVSVVLFLLSILLLVISIFSLSLESRIREFYFFKKLFIANNIP